MLTHLAIRDYLLVDAIDLELPPGLTVLTGETGAGKSILIDALALALGDRAEGGVVRAGAARAEISAEFSIDGLPLLKAWLEDAGLESAEGRLILRRIIDAGGRSRAFINGSPATLAQLKQAADFLIDIQGQHAHHALLRPAVQRQVLDSFAGAGKLADEAASAWHDWQAALQRRRHAEGYGRERQIEREGFTAVLGELAGLGEDLSRWTELQMEQARLAHVTRLIEGSQALIALLDESDEAVATQLRGMTSKLEELTGLDPSLNEAGQMLASASAVLDEAAHWLRRYADHLSLDPERLAELDRRMAEMYRLARKHRVQPEALADLQFDLQQRLQALADEDDLPALEQAEQRALALYQAHAGALSEARREAAADLSSRVTEAMHELALAGGAFRVRLDPVAEPRAHGLEEVEFEVASHPGLPAGPLSRVASGGELSRISLGIQTALSGEAGVPTLIFDEVDVGIGGAVAEAVGRRLARLGMTRQVLVITHLPQVAARGTHHLRVQKLDAGGSVTTRIEVLDATARIEEIARMLGGMKITATTRKHAAEMLAG